MSDSTSGAHEVEAVVVTDEQRCQVLELVSKEPGVGIAIALRRCGVAGTKGQLNRFVTQNTELADDIQHARAKRIRTELLRRAIDGVEEPIVNKDGDVVGYKTIYSDRLLAKAADLYLPEAHALAQRRIGVELTGAGGGPVQIEDRSASLAAVALVLHQIGALDGSGAPVVELPAAQGLLAESPPR